MNNMKPNSSRYPHIVKIVDCPSRAASIVETLSPVTGKSNVQEIPADADTILDWINGPNLAQNALPGLDDGQRDFLITGCTQSDWDFLWGRV